MRSGALAGGVGVRRSGLLGLCPQVLQHRLDHHVAVGIRTISQGTSEPGRATVPPCSTLTKAGNPMVRATIAGEISSAHGPPTQARVGGDWQGIVTVGVGSAIGQSSL